MFSKPVNMPYELPFTLPQNRLLASVAVFETLPEKLNRREPFTAKILQRLVKPTS